MKRKLFVLVLVACSLLSCTDGIWNAIHDLEDKYSDLDGRVAKLEELCKEMNTNISSLQTLVSVILTNDYIISTTPITKDGKEIGYTITFAIHEPITIYHGQNGADGKDGQNGKDGKDGKNGENGTNGQDGKDGADGITPIIGVAQDETDHAYYWTLNGEWLLDANGNRIPLTSRDGINGQDGQDGQDGKDGKDGKDGTNGQDGQDGITPRLKIENGYWFISYDNGATWTQLGKAVGENGKDGKDGTDGQDGEKGEKGDQGEPGFSMFTEVTQDDEFVYFKLYNGTVLTVPKGNKEQKVQIVDGAIMAPFSVSATKQVYFSQGNLLFDSIGTHQCVDGTSKAGTWRFAEKQWDLGRDFVWGSSGYRDDNLTITSDISGTYYDWGVYNAITNGGNEPNKWRTLTKDEWNYLLNGRIKAKFLKKIVVINQTIAGLLILPDNSLYTVDEIPRHYYTSETSFEELQRNGAVYMPFSILTSSSSQYSSGIYKGFWCSTFSRIYEDNKYAYQIGVYYREVYSYVQDESLQITDMPTGHVRQCRLVKDVE